MSTWGGARPGAGRKPKDDATAALHGSRQRSKPKRTTPVPPPADVAIPADLPAEQRSVWLELAPHAIAARTLVAGTVAAFRDLCESIVLKRALLERIQTDGLTYLKVTVDGSGQEHQELKAHPLLSQHRGLMQRVEAGMTRFKLAPIGKEIVPPEAPKDEWDEFDNPESVH